MGNFCSLLHHGKRRKEDEEFTTRKNQYRNTPKTPEKITAEPPRQGLLPEQSPLRKIVLFWYGLIIGFVNPAAAGWT